MSEDGTMVTVSRMDSPPKTTEPDPSASAGASDTESNSGRDNEVGYTHRKDCLRSVRIVISVVDVFVLSRYSQAFW